VAVWVFIQWPKKGSPLAHACLVSIEQHRELCEAFEARIAAGSEPKTAWRQAVSAARLTPTWILSCMLEIERHRLRLGFSEDWICERAGLATRAHGKWLRPWTPGTGRTPSRWVLDILALTVSGGDLASLMTGVSCKPLLREEYDAALKRLAIRHAGHCIGYRRQRREHMVRLSALGVEAYRRKVSAETRRRIASEAAIVQARRMTPAERSARARAAACARWATQPAAS
jgi:hypothetical protein